MSGSTFGELFRVTNFGESHGPAIGCVIDGCPPGLALSEADIQEWLDEKSPADLVSALYQMLEPPAWADELCTPPAVPITTPAPEMFTECMQRPHLHAWPKTAIGAAEVGALFVGTPPPRHTNIRTHQVGPASRITIAGLVRGTAPPRHAIEEVIKTAAR